MVYSPQFSYNSINITIAKPSYRFKVPAIVSAFSLNKNMVNFEKEQKVDVMPCETTEKTIPELEKEGWEYLYSFHCNIQEQWRGACEKAQEAIRSGLYEVILVPGKNELEKKDGIQYLYRKKTQKLVDLEKQHGY